MLRFIRGLLRGLLLAATYVSLCGFFFIFPIPKSDERKVAEMIQARNWHGVINFTTERLNGAPQRNATNDTMLNFRCLAHIGLNQLDDAEKDCQQSLQAVPDSHNPTNMLGLIRLRRGQNTEAVPFFEKAVQLKPDFGIGWANLVATYSAMGETGKAWDAYQKLAAVDVSRAKTQKALYRIPDARPADKGEPIPIGGAKPATTLAAAKPAAPGDADLQAAQKAVLDEPGNAALWRTLGQKYVAAGDHERALKAYGEAMKLEPQNLDTLEAAGALHAKLGQKERAKEIGDAIAKLDAARGEKFLAEHLKP
jgi:tetratricopeptide (TPR) repeat protein